MDNPTIQPRRNDIGALWPRYDKFNKEYFTGHVEVNGVRIDIVIFENTFRRKDSHPTMVIREDHVKARIKAEKGEQGGRQWKWGEEQYATDTDNS